MKYTEEKVNYIELLNKAMAPMINFGHLQYKQVANTGAEYIKMLDSVGTAYFLDITGFDNEHLLLDVFAVAIGNTPASVITDVEKRRSLMILFKEDQ